MNDPTIPPSVPAEPLSPQQQAQYDGSPAPAPQPPPPQDDSRFLNTTNFIFKVEGGLTNDPNDKGGLTKYGIDASSHPGVDIANLTQDQARDIYRKDFEASGAQQLSGPAQDIYYDAAVNHGPSAAVKILQRALGDVDVDGKLGPQTVGSFDQKDSAQVAERMLAERQKLYARIVANDPSQRGFLAGWMNRLNMLRSFALGPKGQGQ